MMKVFSYILKMERRIFTSLNRHYDRKIPNFIFRNTTHVGGAIITIVATTCAMFFLKGEWRTPAIASGCALALSHLPVAIVKKLYPRKRPYLAVQEARVSDNPLDDHSFPSGHSTAIFSVIVPFMMFAPFTITFLLPLGIIVAMSRIFLGLHYPTDVLAGGILGGTVGALSYHSVSAWL